MKHPIGLDYKYAAQERMHAACDGDIDLFFRQCSEGVAEIERQHGFKFKVGVPEGWTPPTITWPEDWKRPAKQD